MEIKQLRYFIEVAKREHISETALELNIAQSAISRQITLLEQELNVSLFKKQGRNITLMNMLEITNASKTSIEYAYKMINFAPFNSSVVSFLSV